MIIPLLLLYFYMLVTQEHMHHLIPVNPVADVGYMDPRILRFRRVCRQQKEHEGPREDGLSEVLPAIPLHPNHPISVV